MLSGSMEPGFYRGDILFLHMGRAPVRAGEVVVFNINGRDIPIVHRAIKVAFPQATAAPLLFAARARRTRLAVWRICLHTRSPAPAPGPTAASLSKPGDTTRALCAGSQVHERASGPPHLDILTKVCTTRLRFWRGQAGNLTSRCRTVCASRILAAVHPAKTDRPLPAGAATGSVRSTLPHINSEHACEWM